MSALRDILHWAIIAAWLVLMLYWAFNAHRRDNEPASASMENQKRIVFGPAAVIVVWIVSRLAIVRRMHLYVQAHTGWAIVGAITVAAGFGLALWARRTSGGNRGLPGTHGTSGELLTTGPYRLVRQPVYSALLVMAFGTAIALGPTWGIAGILVATNFIWNARAEEAELARRFPDSWPAYRASTKMLIPGVF